jgi:hypothetical protein
MFEISDIMTYNISWATQKGLVLGSEAQFVKKCLQTYKDRFECSKNASNIVLDSTFKYDIDIIGLQECIDEKGGFQSTINRFYNPLSNDLLDKQYRYIESKKIQNSNGNNIFNILIYSFDKLREEPKCYTINVSDDKNDIRLIQFVYFKKNKILVLNCHLPHNCDIVEIIDKIHKIIKKKYNCRRIIILGDFNMSIYDIPKEILFISKDNFEIKVNVPSKISEHNSCCWDIDYKVLGDIILDSKKGGNLIVVDELEGELASDHKPVILNYQSNKKYVGGNCSICGKAGHNKRTCKARAKSPPKAKGPPRAKSSPKARAKSPPKARAKSPKAKGPPKARAKSPKAKSPPKARAKSPPKARAKSPKAKSPPKAAEEVKITTSDFSQTGGIIFNYNGDNYLIIIKEVLSESSVHKLVFSGEIRKMLNLKNYNNEFVIMDGPIKLSKSTKVVIGIENVNNTYKNGRIKYRTETIFGRTS